MAYVAEITVGANPAKTLIKAAFAAPRTAAGQALARALTSGRMLKPAGAIGAVVGLGALAAQTDAGRAAIAQVKGFFRRDSTTGRTSYVRRHTRNLG